MRSVMLTSKYFQPDFSGISHRAFTHWHWLHNYCEWSHPKKNPIQFISSCAFRANHGICLSLVNPFAYFSLKFVVFFYWLFKVADPEFISIFVFYRFSVAPCDRYIHLAVTIRSLDWFSTRPIDANIHFILESDIRRANVDSQGSVLAGNGKTQKLWR